MRLENNKNLSAMNTFGMKVSCAAFLEYDTIEDLFKIDFENLPKPVLHMGGGSNLLFTRDFPGTVVHSCIRYIRTAGDDGDEVLVEAGAGVVFDDFVDWACEMGYWGAENLSLIPGEVGASAVQNIGAYGVEAKDIIVRVNCFDTVKRDLVVFENADCRYGYRSSFFKEDEAKGRYIVTAVLFRLTREYSPKLEYGNIRAVLDGTDIDLPGDVRNAIIGIRKAKLPDPAEIGSAGSFFKNPIISREHFERICAEAGEGVKVPHFDTAEGVKVPAAWMIERCGFKGKTLGGAAVYEKQPLVIVNLSGSATPEEVIGLETEIIDAVKARFGVELHPEVEHI
ncbi:MAG: UDP-N-acetylmuramate dehydrogenase [Bacteroidia bacterium]|nr:UDP-N-acetylmuramate dehydrogenase [Bacteroidia bacterium]